MSGPRAYNGPYPNHSSRTMAEVMAEEASLLRRVEWARRDYERLLGEAVERGLIQPGRPTPLPSASEDCRGGVTPDAPAAFSSDGSFHGQSFTPEARHDHG